MTRISTRYTLAAALILGLNGAALAAVLPPDVQLHPKQELVRNNGSEPETLDPAMASGVPANNIIRDLFEGLTSADSTGKIVPGVAESWKQTGPLTWVFNLRKDAKWSNDDPVTTDDFVYGLRRFVDPATASKYAATFGVFIKNGKEIVEGKMPPAELGVKALDKHTLEITTPYPVLFLPEVLTNLQLGPVHKATVEKFGKEWTKPGNIVGNGAFVLADWQVNSKVVLTKNYRYWDAKNVQLTKWTYLPIEDGNADVKLYESGENDWVAQLPPGTFDKYKAQYPKEIRNTPMLALRYYSLQNQDPLLKDIRVRKALSMVIDRDIHMGHLKTTLQTFIARFFELDAVQARFRPHHFPFTEPSAEMDIRCDRSGGKLVFNTGDDWLEILGCGMVHPNVLTNCGLDPDEWQGFAFGTGVDRLAMLKYGMDDLRAFFDGDLRWLRHYGFAALDVPTLSGGVGA